MEHGPDLRNPSTSICAALSWSVFSLPCAAIRYDLRDDVKRCTASEARLVSRVGHFLKVSTPIHVLLLANGSDIANFVFVAGIMAPA